MKKLLTFISAVACMVLTSCLGDNNGTQTLEVPINNYFNVVTPLEGGEASYFDNVSYTFKFDLNAQTADITMTGLRLTDGSGYSTLTFPAVPYTYDSNGWMVFNRKDMVPTAVGVSQTPIFNSFNVKILLRIIDGYYYPVTDMSFVVNGGFRVRSVMRNFLELGTTVVTAKMPNPQDPESLVDYRFEPQQGSAPVYVFSFNATNKTVTVDITGAKFAQQMPAMNMRFKNIPFNVDSSGIITFAIDELIPFLVSGSSEKPDDSHPISNLSCTINDLTGAVFNFTCTITTPATESMPVEIVVPYNVNFRSSYPSSGSQTEEK